MSEEFPPINFTEQGLPRGLAVEIVQEIQRRQGSDLAIEFLPWARAFREAKGGGEVGLFSMARTPEREKQFKWVGPIVTFYSSIYAPAQNGMRLRSMEDAKRASAVLVVRDWFTAEELKTLGFQNLVSVSEPVTAIKMLLAKRAPFFATERLSMPDILAKAGIAEDSLEIVYSYASSEGYIAFSLDTPDATVNTWVAHLREMKRDGSFLKIYRRWLPKDNPPIGIKL
ncbi:transporter substrate-binding domain-containing protein [Paucibacter sp. TC2R-5]|uniref:substrate-binding periplasmic protein n=1 Tax=Paucibacter sp. TC2R-5 TaxID=2893555 RepID=UPI0021E3BA9B|nr:transporter substrate-binding domain-containing protein [Paucibacter sp. TC2R-5]MCV2360862.1 transporter substrate-binding domain-containing protein [Paucibacter sp. TC2R-5]